MLRQLTAKHGLMRESVSAFVFESYERNTGIFIMKDNNELQINSRIKLTDKKLGQSFSADAFLLAAFAKQTSAAAVDLGSGTGCCSLLLADRNKAEHIYAVELQPALFSATVSNIKANKFEHIITAIHSDIRTLDADSLDKKIEVVIANPPYFKAGSGKMSMNELKNAARFELFGELCDFCASAAKLLANSENGSFYCTTRPERQDELTQHLENVGFYIKKSVFVCHNKSSSPSMLLTEATLKNDSVPKRLYYLYLYEQNGSESHDAKKIYDTLSFEEFFEKYE